jgi:hypothetical protein
MSEILEVAEKMCVKQSKLSWIMLAEREGIWCVRNLKFENW